MKRPAAQSIDLRFVTVIALLLLGAAVVTNLPVFASWQWPRNVLRAILWLVALAILLLDARSRRPPARPRSERTILVSLAVVALFAAGSYYHFGRFHRQGHFLHYHEFYHYTMGSKYFPELGYDGLYCATYRALIENDQSLYDRIPVIKDLRTYRFEGKDVCWQRSESVVSLFSEARWREFRQDVLFFQSKIPPDSWPYVLVDHGYNATPFWTLIASSLASRLDLNDRTLSILASLDPLLIVVMLLLVWYGFGARTSLLFAIFFFANSFASFDITGGAFLRQLWLVSLVGFVCLFRKGRMGAAGASLAVAILDRIFPLLFGLLPVVLFVKESVRRRSLRHGLTRFVAVLVCALALLGGWSAAKTGGVAAWQAFYRNIVVHERWFYINQISLRNLFIVNPVTSRQFQATGWEEAAWMREKETLDAQSKDTLLAVRVLMVALLVALMAKEKDPLVSLGLLSFAPFVLLYPANYYYTFLGIIILCWRSSFRLAVTVMALQVLFWLLSVFLPSPVESELLYWIVSLCLASAFVAFLSAELRRSARGERAFRRSVLAVLIAGGLILVGSVGADVNTVRADRGWVALDLIPQDVRSLQGATARSQQMTDWGSGWSRNDHLVFLAEGPGAEATLEVPARRTASYKVRVDYSTSPVFGTVQLAVNDQALREPVNLFSPRVGILPAVYTGIRLNKGTNDFTFVARSKDQASPSYHFAIDQIVLVRESAAGGAAGPVSAEKSRQEALDGALSWVSAHPADFFDGGFNAVCAEIVTLSYLASHPQLADRRAAYLKEIRERLARLDSRPAYRVQPAEYEMLVAVAYAARRLDLAFPLFDPMAGKVRQWAASSRYTDRSGFQPLFLGEYLHRLHPADEPLGARDQSVLYRGYAEGRLLEMVAGGVDRRQVPVVSSTLFSITRDIYALTDFGQEPPPGAGIFADSGFWAQLCDQGIRWGMEAGDLLTVARLVLGARSLRVASVVPSFQPAADFLVQYQEPDGSFGATNPSSPDPFRDGVLAAILAIASSLPSTEPD